MWTSLREYHRPSNVGAALRLLARPSLRTVPLAGGAWLVARCDPSVQAVVDLSNLNLAFVTKRDQRLQIGAMTTLQSLVKHPLVQEFGGGLLAKASQRSAPLSIRNVATLGGTLAVGEAASEALLALLVLDAELVIRSPQARTLTLEAFLTSRGEHLPPQALITEVCLPPLPPGSGSSLAEISLTPRDRPIVNAAAVVLRRGDPLDMVRLALSGVAPDPVRLPELEAMLMHQPFESELLMRAAEALSGMIDPPDDFRASAAYRRAMAGVVVERALRRAWEQGTAEEAWTSA